MSLKLSKHRLSSSILTSPKARNKRFTNWREFGSHTLQSTVLKVPFCNYEWLINFNSYNNSNNNGALPSGLRECDTGFNFLLCKSLIKIELILVTQKDVHFPMSLCGHHPVHLSDPGEEGTRILPSEVNVSGCVSHDCRDSCIVMSGSLCAAC